MRPQSARESHSHRYWDAAGALYAYLFIELSKQGIDVIGESQLVGYPSQFPSVSMMDWTNGKPNARYWVLKLIKDNFHAGDTLESGEASRWTEVVVQGFNTPTGQNLLLANKRNKESVVTLPNRSDMYTSPSRTAKRRSAPRTTQASGPKVTLSPFAVAVVSWK